MDFKKELSKFGYNKGNSIDVDILIDEILPELLNKKQNFENLNQIILSELWKFCEKEFNADFEEDYINGYGRKTGMSNRTEKFSKSLTKKMKLWKQYV
jgi:hypothetical protein